MSDQSPKPAVGQVWADNDWRSQGRTVRVDAIEGTHAVVTCLTNSDDQQRLVDDDRYGAFDRRGKTSRILLSRMRPTSTGYRYLRTEPVAALAAEDTQ